MNREELVAQVAAAPNDDGPRLVFADWLLQQPDEIDRARGEYISLACSTIRSPKRAARLKELLDKYEAAWLGPLHERMHHERQWSRGFLEACAIAQRVPVAIEPMLGHETWRTLRTLELIHTMLGVDAQLQLLAQRELGNLRTLHLCHSVIEGLTTASVTPPVSELALFPVGPPLTELAPLLAAAPCFERVRKLHVYRCTPQLACTIARPELTLIAVQSPDAVAGWITELERRRATFDEVRLVEGINVLVARRGIELVLRRAPSGRWSALEIRWTDAGDEGSTRSRVIGALGRLPENVVTHLAFVGPPKSRFDVDRWKRRIVGALAPRQAGLQVR